jgi:transcriptional regulator with XRE-family HTH domain
MSSRERIKQIRSILELSQVKFAERIAISPSYLGGIETGDKKVNDRILRIISMEFGASEHWLRTGEGEMFNEIADANVAVATSLFKSLTPEYQEIVLVLLNAFTDLQNSRKTS